MMVIDHERHYNVKDHDDDADDGDDDDDDDNDDAAFG